MKRFLLLLTFAIGFFPLLHAQSADSTASQDPGYQDTPSPKKSSTQRAARQLSVLQQKLNLNQDQVVRLRMILLNEDIALDSLRSNRSGDRKSDAYSRRTIVQGADQKIDALLTADQKPLYLQWKQEQRQKALERRKNSTSGGTPQQ